MDGNATRPLHMPRRRPAPGRNAPSITPPGSPPQTALSLSNSSNGNSMAGTEPLRIQNIACVGAGYVGGPTCAVIASRIPNVKVTVVDIDQKRIDAWNSHRLPIYEPKLEENVKLCRDGIPGARPPNLFFTTNLDDVLAEADLIFVSVQTPTKTVGLGAGSASDLVYVETAIRKIAEISTTDKIVVEKSTVPCRTAENIRDILAANGKPGVKFDVLSNPEFLAEGTAISDLLYPDRILIGSLPDADGLRAAAALADVYAQWVPRERIITMNLWSSELAKLAANALLAQRISSINALSAICEATGAEIDEVSYAVGLDKRIGPYMLKSSVGFGGSCFKKDIYSLVWLAESLHLPEVASYWKSVVDINEWQKDRFTKRVITSLYNTLTNKKVAIFGFAYKKNTGDTRESAAISIVKSLVNERARIAIYDPQVRASQIWSDLNAAIPDRLALEDCITVSTDAYSACTDAHAVVIVTEWDEFKVAPLHESPKLVPADRLAPAIAELKKDVSFLSLDGQLSLSPPERKRLEAAAAAAASAVAASSSATKSHVSGHSTIDPPVARVDWSRIAGVMRKPMFVFDGRNIVDAARLETLGFRVECIGNARSGGVNR